MLYVWFYMQLAGMLYQCLDRCLKWRVTRTHTEHPVLGYPGKITMVPAAARAMKLNNNRKGSNDRDGNHHLS